LIVGSGGRAWVPFSQPGELHVLLVDNQWRVPYGGGFDLFSGSTMSTHDATVLAQQQGVMHEPSPPFPLSFPQKHLFGSLTISGTMVFFGTSISQFPDDIFALNRLGALTGGATYAIDLGTITSSVTGSSLNPFGGLNLANYGGAVAVIPGIAPDDNYVVTLEVSRIASVHVTGNRAPTANAALGFTSQGNVIYRLKTWLMRFLNIN
jgi:hypothetical protein